MADEEWQSACNAQRRANEGRKHHPSASHPTTPKYAIPILRHYSIPLYAISILLLWIREQRGSGETGNGERLNAWQPRCRRILASSVANEPPNSADGVLQR